MLTQERMRTIFGVYRLWAGINHEMFEAGMKEHCVTKEEQQECIKAWSVFCKACKKRFNMLDCYYCDECGQSLPLPEDLFLLELKNERMDDDEHSTRIHGQHSCQGSKFCVYCGHPK